MATMEPDKDGTPSCEVLLRNNYIRIRDNFQTFTNEWIDHKAVPWFRSGILHREKRECVEAQPSC